MNSDDQKLYTSVDMSDVERAVNEEDRKSLSQSKSLETRTDWAWAKSGSGQSLGCEPRRRSTGDQEDHNSSIFAHQEAGSWRAGHGNDMVRFERGHSGGVDKLFAEAKGSHRSFQVMAVDVVWQARHVTAVT